MSRAFPAVGRVLLCVRCRRSFDVLEASLGARSDEEHRWIVPDEYVCGGCLEAAGEVTTGALSAATVAAGRARTGQETATGEGGRTVGEVLS